MDFSTWVLIAAVFTTPMAFDLDLFENPYIRDINSRCSGSQLCDLVDCQYTGPLQFSNHSFNKCDCHIKCLEHGTCCINFEEVCLAESIGNFQDNEELETLRNLSKNRYKSQEDFDQFLTARKKEVLVEKIDDGTNVYFMYVRCPKCEGTLCNDAVAAKCHAETFTEYEQVIPVTSNGTLYRNVYCYQCNNPTGTEDVQYVPIDIACNMDNASSAFETYERDGQSRMIDIINSKQCVLAHSNLSGVISPTVNIVSSCSFYPRGKPSNFNSMKIACDSYSAYFAGIKKRAFKNPHCAALCSGFDEDTKDPRECVCSFGTETSNCESAEEIYKNVFSYFVPFFRIALDFKGEPSVEAKRVKVCDIKLKVLAVHTMSCENRFCPIGYFKQNNTCIHVDHLEMFTIDESLQKSLRICAEFSSNVTQKLTDFAEEFTKVLYNNTKGVEVAQFSSSSSGCEEKGLVGSFLNLQAPSGFNRFSFLVLRMFESSDEIMSNISKSFDIGSLEILANQGSECPNDYKHDIVDGYLDWTSSERKRAELSIFYSNLETTTKFYIPKYDFFLSPKEHEWKIVASKSEDSWKLEISIEVCYKIDSLCDDSSFESILCDTTRPITHTKTEKETSLIEPEVEWMDWEVVLNLFCVILSIICLSLTLVVHCIFPKIMETGGRAFTPLLISLLFAEFGMLFSGLKLWDPVVCSFFAAFQHFGWLSSFAWTAVLSWDIFSHFVIDKTDSVALWLPYIALGWGLPLLIVAVCSVLHCFGYFQYGHGKVCWILDAVHLGIAFGLPVVLIIIFNIVLYLFTIVNLSRRMDASKRANETYNLKVRFILYVKLSSVVGFTWLFGFLANIEALSFLRYVFSICAGLNGVFVSLSFTLSGRAIQTFRDALSRVSFTRSTSLPSPSDMQ